MSQFFIGAMYSTGFLCFLLVLEYGTKRSNVSKEITRKIAHIASGLFALGMAYVLDPWVFITFALLFFLLMVYSYRKDFFRSIHGVKRKTYGEILFPVGILSAYVISGATFDFTAAVVILSLSDPLSGFVGGLVRDTQRLFASVAFFLSAFVILFLFFPTQQFLLLLGIALVVTITERVSRYGTDNLSIPVCTSLLLRFML